jgi:hypothetical protein
MAYARFGENGSDVYVFLNVAGYYECCACGLGGPERHRTTTSIIRHLRAHEAAGDCVPVDVIPCLHRERAENDQWIADAHQDLEDLDI